MSTQRRPLTARAQHAARHPSRMRAAQPGPACVPSAAGCAQGLPQRSQHAVCCSPGHLQGLCRTRWQLTRRLLCKRSQFSQCVPLTVRRVRRSLQQSGSLLGGCRRRRAWPGQPLQPLQPCCSARSGCSLHAGRGACPARARLADSSRGGACLGTAHPPGPARSGPRERRRLLCPPWPPGAQGSRRGGRCAGPSAAASGQRQAAGRPAGCGPSTGSRGAPARSL